MNVTLRDLLEAGVHFGHQLRRFNPKSKKYVFDNRHGISVIDLEKTYDLLQVAYDYIEETVASGGSILFVGTKKQAQEIVREAAVACGMHFCANRWMGGTLTNFQTITGSIGKFKRYLGMEADGTLATMHKKEAAAIRREMTRMLRNFEGLKEMNTLPTAMFVVDINNEDIAVKEANRLGIPVVALVDTNSDPNLVEYPIPGNDDSIKSIRVIVETILDAVQNGLARREAPPPERYERPSGGFATSMAGRDSTVDERVPVTSRTRKAEEESDEIPTSFSTDADDA